MDHRDRRPIDEPPPPPRPKTFSGYQPSGRTLEMPLPMVPHLPAPYDEADLGAFKAMRDGTAAAHQQQRVLEWIIMAANTYGDPYVPGDPHASDYGMGKQHIGRQIVKLINMRPSRSERGEQG